MKPTRPPRTIPGTTEDILAYLKEHGVSDKDFVAPSHRKASRISKKAKAAYSA